MKKYHQSHHLDRERHRNDRTNSNDTVIEILAETTMISKEIEAIEEISKIIDTEVDRTVQDICQTPIIRDDIRIDKITIRHMTLEHTLIILGITTTLINKK